MNHDISRMTQIGIVSFGEYCFEKEEGKTGVYSRVTSFKPWIQENAPGTQDSNCV